MIKSIVNKLKKNEELTHKERELLLFMLDQQQKCIDYYSQSFAGTWDNEQVNVNWRANKYHTAVEEKIEELSEQDVVDVEAVVKS